MAARTNTDPKGFVRAVDEFTRTPWGLYMARPTPGRVQFHYLESWLLPELGVRVNIFHWRPGHELDQDYYIDIADIAPTDDTWHTVDNYLDLVVRTGTGTKLLDVDELLEAEQMGLVSPETAERAIHTAVAVIDGLARHHDDLDAWLGSHGIELSWR